MRSATRIPRLLSPVCTAAVCTVALLACTDANGTPPDAAPETIEMTAPAVQEPPGGAGYSTGFYRRLAEAADGFRTGERMFVVIDTVFPYEVTIVTPDSAEAVAEQEGRGAPAVLVPVQTEFDDPTSAQPAMLFVLCHDPDTKAVMCFAPEETLQMRQIDSLTIAIHGRDTTIRRSLGPVDALFLGLSAVDKFVLPYLTQVYGASFADSVRNAIVDTLATMRAGPPPN